MLLRRRRERRETIERLYGAIVAQARRPFLYSELAVPDTVEGRFDMIVLHVFLLFRRLAEGDADARAVGQGVFDRFVEDMDASLREMGTGDLAVPRRMRDMGEAFYGRAHAYDAALSEEGDDVLASALARNIYGGDGSADAPRSLAHYVRNAAAVLANTRIEEIIRAENAFSNVSGR